LKFGAFEVTDHCVLMSSPQITGGLGAINGNDVYSLFKQLENFPKPFTLALGTACNCHGVISLIKIIK